MPISVKCPECEAPYKVPDEAAGKAIKCKKCGAKISIPAADADVGDGGGNDFAAMGPGADSGGGETKAKKPGSKKTLMIVGIAAALLTCCICLPGGAVGAMWWFVWRPAAALVEQAGKEKGLQFKDDPFKDAFKDAFKDLNKKKTSLDRKDPLAPKEPRVAALSRRDLLVELWVSSADLANRSAPGKRWQLASVAAGSV